MTRMPAISLAAVPGRRRRIIELAAEVERRGFAGIFCPSLGDNLALCEAIALATSEIEFGTSITPIYTRNVADFASTAGFIHEVSGGRFRFGVGVSHEPAMKRLGITQGKPLADMRQFVTDLKAVPRVGEQPPIVLATLRRKMIALAEEIGDGMVFANGARSHMATSLNVLEAESRSGSDFFIGNMIPTCISDDVEAAKAVNRRTLTSYALLPNYRNYWKEAGYEEEMNAVEEAVAAKDFDRVPDCLSDRWLADTTLFGPADEVREGIEAWFDAGIKTPIIVPSSAHGNQLDAIAECFALWD
jgi:alkanesulfonate monooxygenase SsuD/methylene tetrahydromethanopterin reductase-like flavin-dependent oxidoreductase (luciferase family)